MRDAGCKGLMDFPRLGPTTSSAMVAAIGTGDSFTKGRDFAAWLGLVPKQDLDRRPHHPRQDIQARQSLPACLVRPGGMGCADQAQQLAAPRPQAVARGGQEAAASQRPRHRARQQAARIVWSVLDENEMEDRSSRRMRTLVTLMAR